MSVELTSGDSILSLSDSTNPADTVLVHPVPGGFCVGLCADGRVSGAGPGVENLGETPAGGAERFPVVHPVRLPGREAGAMEGVADGVLGERAWLIPCAVAAGTGGCVQGALSHVGRCPDDRGQRLYADCAVVYAPGDLDAVADPGYRGDCRPGGAAAGVGRDQPGQVARLERSPVGVCA